MSAEDSAREQGMRLSHLKADVPRLIQEFRQYAVSEAYARLAQRSIVDRHDHVRLDLSNVVDDLCEVQPRS